jgi:dephospho-CoA kinase
VQQAKGDTQLAALFVMSWIFRSPRASLVGRSRLGSWLFGPCSLVLVPCSLVLWILFFGSWFFGTCFLVLWCLLLGSCSFFLVPLFPMLKIGLTGGIGSGKTTAAKLFELLNVPVYYADAAAKGLYSSDKELMHQIKTQFGQDIYTGETLNRQQLAAIVFNDPAQLERLNQLVHPLTIRDAEQWMQQQTAPYVIKEAALLFESGAASGLDYIIGVKAPVHIRMKRVMDRDQLSREEVMSRMQKQIDEDIKMRLCDFVLVNDEQVLLIPQVIELHQELGKLAG